MRIMTEDARRPPCTLPGRFIMPQRPAGEIGPEQTLHMDADRFTNLQKRSKFILALVAGNFARVLDLQAHIEAAVRSSADLECGVCELGVAQSLAERKERPDSLVIEPAVPHVHALGVGGLVFDAGGRPLRISGVGGG